MPNIGGWSIGGGSSGGGGGSSSAFGGGPPTGGTAQSDRLPIGVPENYTTRVPRDLTGMSARGGEGWAAAGAGHGTFAERGPRYFDGDEYTPAGMSPAAIEQLQIGLAQAGFLNESFNPRTWDENSAGAYKSLLTFANARGITWEAALQLALANSGGGGPVQYDPATGQFMGGGAGGSGTEPPPLITRTTDPIVLRRMFREIAIQEAGVGWDENRINQAVQAYNDMEIKRQTELYQLQTANGGMGQAGSVVDIPSAESWMQGHVENQDPGAVQREDMLGYLDEFMNLANSTAWGAGGQM